MNNTKISLHLTINSLIKGANITLLWNYIGWHSKYSDYNSQVDWNQTLIRKIEDIETCMFKGQGDFIKAIGEKPKFIIVSNEILSIIENLWEFDTKFTREQVFNLPHVGTISNKYKVYCCPYIRANRVLVGVDEKKLNNPAYWGVVKVDNIPVIDTKNL